MPHDRLSGGGCSLTTTGQRCAPGCALLVLLGTQREELGLRPGQVMVNGKRKTTYYLKDKKKNEFSNNLSILKNKSSMSKLIEISGSPFKKVFMEKNVHLFRVCLHCLKII